MMMNMDLKVRLDLPMTVGSTGREDRLHHLVDRTLVRRSFSREALPRLHKGQSGPILGASSRIEERSPEKVGPSRRRSPRGRRTSSIIAGPTSVSCPDRLSMVAAAVTTAVGTSGNSRPDPEASDCVQRCRSSKRFPSNTSSPCMSRRRTPDVTCVEKLPPVIGEGDDADSVGTGLGAEASGKLTKVGATIASKLPRVDDRKGDPSDGDGNNIGGSNIMAKQSQIKATVPTATALPPAKQASPLTPSTTTTTTTRRKSHHDLSSSRTQINSGTVEDEVPEEVGELRMKSLRRRRRSVTKPVDGNDSDSDVPSLPAARPRRKKPSALRRISTMDAIPVCPTGQSSKVSRRSTIPVGSAKEWYRPRFLRPGQAIGLFRRSVRKVSLVLSWFKSLCKKQQDSTDQTLKSFLDMAKELEEVTTTQNIEEKSGLAFDPKEFCAKKEVHLTEEARAILTTPSRGRSAEMIQKVLSVLQTLKAFAEYPLHMQQKFAKVAWFQEIPPRRLILKQGHKAENFYFILSGSAIVKKITKDSQTGQLEMRAVARMRDGQSFGEVALLHQTVRTATVESATAMDVLVITREDFQRIFFNTIDEKDPEHISFCKNQVAFLDDFPMDLCMKNPGTCLFHYFRPGAVVVSDSRESDWIYIVRSGSCQVIKRLDAVNPCRPWCNRKIDLRVKLPRNGTAEPGPRVDTRLRQQKILCMEEEEEARSDDDLSSFDFEEGYEVNEESPNESDEDQQQEFDEKPARVTRFQLPARPLTCGQPEIPPPMATIAEERPLPVEKQNRKTPPKSAPTPTMGMTPVSGTNKPGFSKSKLFFLPEIKKAYIDQEPDKPVMPASWAALDEEEDDRITLADAMTIDARSTRSVRPAKTPEVNSASCFVQLRRLRPKDAFGLEMIKFDDDKSFDVADHTSVALVSNGCELIMLSKRFFERHATDLSKKHIREKVRPFPCGDTLQHNLQIEVNWDLFRKDLVGDFIQFVHESQNLPTVR